jgi:hypothetical protein
VRQLGRRDERLGLHLRRELVRTVVRVDEAGDVTTETQTETQVTRDRIR